MSYTSSTRRPVRRSFSRRFQGVGALVGIIAVVLGVIVVNALPYTNSQSQTCTVESKDRTTGLKGKSDMRVYTEDCGVLRVKDMFFAGEWNSADTFSEIKEGQTYEITTTGYRVGIFSSFPIIREVAPVKG